MNDTPIALTWEDRTARPNLFDPPERLARIRDTAPLTPMTFADGHVGWLATGHEAVRAVLADKRFSARRDIAHPRFAMGQATDPTGQPTPPGMFTQMDPPDHTRFRRALIAEFTVHRIRRLEAGIAETTRRCLADMERTGPPADLVSDLALPVPSTVICGLLGMDYDARGDFPRAMATVTDLDRSEADRAEAIATLVGFFPPLIEEKRRRPDDAFFSALVNGGEFTDQELSTVGMLLFGAGFETTANLLTMGTFLLLQRPDQLAALRADPSHIDNAVEELLRYINGPLGILRTATEDIEIDGIRIEKGQSVELLVGIANRDPQRFTDPDRLDITRSARGQLSFGHGMHQCLGQQLARAELRTVWPALLSALPGLRLAVPPDEVPIDTTSIIYRAQRLPVTW